MARDKYHAIVREILEEEGWKLLIAQLYDLKMLIFDEKSQTINEWKR
jgi:hypothetical protein